MAKFQQSVQEQVRQRANYLCEYCHASELWQYVCFTVDHVIPLSLGGTNNLENLALACFHCNRRKTNRLKATDPQSNEEVPLFNPRQHLWREHFIWSADRLLIMGLTPIGRATVSALALNRERVINIRAADKEIGRHPPVEDSIQEE
ncbi:HNH endonuclease [Iningainema tapete]|uniref:HNH endonuclease n=1 Tax=Iningainema tapete BLCC-T55 TaxID=2748662 RepID=A0A8J7BWS2_9CYAN|nr:HNH endonuclease [Iningainema tapete BLCC-T55]